MWWSGNASNTADHSSKGCLALRGQTNLSENDVGKQLSPSSLLISAFFGIKRSTMTCLRSGGVWPSASGSPWSQEWSLSRGREASGRSTWSPNRQPSCRWRETCVSLTCRASLFLVLFCFLLISVERFCWSQCNLFGFFAIFRTSVFFFKANVHALVLRLKLKILSYLLSQHSSGVTAELVEILLYFICRTRHQKKKVHQERALCSSDCLKKKGFRRQEGGWDAGWNPQLEGLRWWWSWWRLKLTLTVTSRALVPLVGA